MEFEVDWETVADALAKACEHASRSGICTMSKDEHEAVAQYHRSKAAVQKTDSLVNGVPYRSTESVTLTG